MILTRKNIQGISLEGGVSVNTTKSVPPGPLLVTVALKVKGSPWATDVGPTGVRVTDHWDVARARTGPMARMKVRKEAAHVTQRAARRPW